MNYEVNLHSTRAKRARFGKRIGLLNKEGTLLAVGFFLAALALFVIITGQNMRLVYLVLAVFTFYLVEALWFRYDLKAPRPKANPVSLDGILEPRLLASLKQPLSPRSVWLASTNTLEGSFMAVRLLLPVKDMSNLLSDKPEDLLALWQAADQLRIHGGETQIHGGTFVAVALDTPEMKQFVSQYNLRPEDVLEVYMWLVRLLSYVSRPKPYFGGIGRDWATGFTPTLERYSHNISATIQAGGQHFDFLAHADQVDAIVHGLAEGTGGVAIVGPTGAGKTSMVYGLAQRLLEGKDQALKHYQVVSLSASVILSSQKEHLEALILTLFGEAVRSGNMILFLDEAQLFFNEGTGAFDMSQILLPVLQARRLKIIAAMAPNDYQKLKSQNQALADGLTAVMLSEPSEADTMKIMEDAALTLESQTKVLATYEAVREAYRLSGQYMSDQAYPGKGINLLDQAGAYAEKGIMTTAAVQATIEKTMGVKAVSAKGAEADVLLHLEDKIHERMINQVEAVNAIAAALRRVRAGVTNPNRPSGSFLFLGPTGVGKTELARSLAATYFGDVSQMIRLDMSEYQQPEDVKRLLGDGAESTDSLILAIRKQPFSVVLLDEVEKAHPNILNLLLQLLDEGQLTDQGGRPASFKSAIIIATSNAGATDIIEQIKQGSALANFQRPLVDKLIASGQFKPELINRFDEVVLFRPLKEDELGQVAKLMIGEVNKNLSKQNISVNVTDAALAALVHAGYDPEFGARPMRHVIQKAVEDVVATKILEGTVAAGGSLTLDAGDLKLPDK